MIFDVAAEKLEQAENQMSHSRFGPLLGPTLRKKEVSGSWKHCVMYRSKSCLAYK